MEDTLFWAPHFTLNIDGERLYKLYRKSDGIFKFKHVDEKGLPNGPLAWYECEFCKTRSKTLPVPHNDPDSCNERIMQRSLELT